jgi:hypothetical protein
MLVAEAVQVTVKVHLVQEAKVAAVLQTQVTVKQEQLTKVQAAVVVIIHQIGLVVLAVLVLLLLNTKD